MPNQEAAFSEMTRPINQWRKIAEALPPNLVNQTLYDKIKRATRGESNADLLLTLSLSDAEVGQAFEVEHQWIALRRHQGDASQRFDEPIKEARTDAFNGRMLEEILAEATAKAEERCREKIDVAVRVEGERVAEEHFRAGFEKGEARRMDETVDATVEKIVAGLREAMARNPVRRTADGPRPTQAEHLAKVEVAEERGRAECQEIANQAKGAGYDAGYEHGRQAEREVCLERLAREYTAKQEILDAARAEGWQQGYAEGHEEGYRSAGYAAGEGLIDKPAPELPGDPYLDARASLEIRQAEAALAAVQARERLHTAALFVAGVLVVLIILAISAPLFARAIELMQAAQR